MVQIIRKAKLPDPSEVIERLRPIAAQAHAIALREPRPAGFPLLFTAEVQIIEPAVAFLHEHFVQRAHTADTLRTYAEILDDWFETLEQNDIRWDDADAVDLVAYRNRMVSQPSGHTRRPYLVTTINHRVRGVLRFYEWAVRTGWLGSSSLAGRSTDFALARQQRPARAETSRLVRHERARELLAALQPPYDLMARWQIYTGLRVSELLRLDVKDVSARRAAAAAHHTIDVMRKGRKPGYVIASASLIDETAGYISGHRRAWLQRARRLGREAAHCALFINARGSPAGKNAYQRVISSAGQTCGFKATTHLLRATFACMLLARLERLASEGAAINPLLIVKVLMGHERIETTDRYLRAIAVDACVLKEVLDSLLSEAA